MTARKVIVEIEVPEGVEIEDLLRGVKYRILDPVAELNEILSRARGKAVRIDRIPSRDEIYAERAGH